MSHCNRQPENHLRDPKWQLSSRIVRRQARHSLSSGFTSPPDIPRERTALRDTMNKRGATNVCNWSNIPQCLHRHVIETPVQVPMTDNCWCVGSDKCDSILGEQMSRFSPGFDNVEAPLGLWDWCSWLVFSLPKINSLLLSLLYSARAWLSIFLWPQAFIVNLISLSAATVVYFPGLSADFLLPLRLNVSVLCACLLGLISFRAVSYPVLPWRKFVWQTSKGCAGRKALCISLILTVHLPSLPAAKGSNWYWDPSILHS